MDKVVQNVDVFAHVSARVAHESVGAVVVVVGGIRSDRNDAFEAIDAGGCGRKAQGTVVGRADHSDLSCAPIGFDFFVAIDAGEAFGSSVEPIDDGFGSERFVGSADGRAALGQPGAWGG